MTFLTRSVTALAAVATLSAAAPGSAVPSRPDDKTILHVLNRVGFGPRPGDVERVRGIGLDKYIDQQLHPEGIADAAMPARLSAFETLALSSRAIAEDYYLPAQTARRQAQLANQGDAAKAPPASGTPGQATSGGSPDQGKAARTPEQMELARKERTVVTELTEQKIL